MTKLNSAQLAEYSRQAAAISGLPWEVHYGIFMQESGGNTKARGRDGEKGMAQFMPGTAKDYGLTNPDDPAAAANANGRYMRDLLKMFNGDMSLAIMAYNTGQGNVQKGRIPASTRNKYLPGVLNFAQKAPGGQFVPAAGVVFKPPPSSGKTAPPSSGKTAPQDPDYSPDPLRALLERPAEAVESFEMPSFESLFGDDSGFGFTFQGQDGERYRAMPETNQEVERMSRWAQMDEDLRGRLMELGRQVSQLQAPANPFQQYPDDYDEQILSLIDQV